MCFHLKHNQLFVCL